MIRCLVLLCAVLFAAPAFAAQSVADAQRTALQRNMALWSAQHLRNYTFRLRVSCFCPDARRPVRITVRNGRPHGGQGFETRLNTIPKLFGQIGHVLGDPKAGPTSVRYDARRGFPRSASLDPIKNAIDDEVGWTIDRFRAL